MTDQNTAQITESHLTEIVETFIMAIGMVVDELETQGSMPKGRMARKFDLMPEFLRKHLGVADGLPNPLAVQVAARFAAMLGSGPQPKRPWKPVIIDGDKKLIT